jgi:outer membrane protein OmpA-like peptidoglycan-associated protein
MKKFSLLLMSALVAIGMSAQDVQNVSNGTVYLKDKASDHWYIGLSGGTNLYITKGENDADADFGDRLGWMGQIEVGKWVSPIWGVRGVIDGGLIKHVADVPVWGVNSDVDHNWIGAHVDVMYNINNAWFGYNPDRVWNLIPYLGMGYMYGMVDWKKPNEDGDTFKGQNQSLTWNAGLINNFQVAKNFSIFIDLGYRVMQETFDFARGGDYEWDSMVSGVLGVKFGLGKQEFTPAELMDYNLINDLNSQINRLRAENEDLSKRPASCPECPEIQPVVQEETVYVPNVVFFRLNSAKIDKGQQVSIYNTAQYLKENPNAKVKITAYADRLTGTPEYNMALSERRAKAVADALINEYGIDSSRVSVDWKGDTEQPYEVNEWNRVAIFFTE